MYPGITRSVPRRGRLCLMPGCNIQKELMLFCDGTTSRLAMASKRSARLRGLTEKYALCAKSSRRRRAVASGRDNGKVILSSFLCMAHK